MKSLAECITDLYIKNEIIDPDMRDIYIYGAGLIIDDIIIFSSILILAALIGSFLSGVVFSSVFYFSRIRLGGFHAKRAWVCKLSMLATFGSVMIIFYILKRFNVQWLAVMISIMSTAAVFPIIPVENPNKPLNTQTRQKNKRQGIITVLLFTAAAAVLTAFGAEQGVIISLTLTAVAVLAFAGKIINEKEENKNDKRYEKGTGYDC